MDISRIDPNLKVISKIEREGLVWYDVRKAPFQVYGLYNYQNEPVFKRIPTDVAKATNDGVKALHTHTAGGRIRFSTDSPYIALQAAMPFKGLMSHMALLGSSGFDLYRVKDGVHTFVKSFVPDSNLRQGMESIAEGWTPGEMRDYEINFPLYNNVDSVYIGVHKDYRLEEGGKYRDIKPIVYYGSSITQGGCASRPGTSYQAFISRRFDLDYINLGFSGSARGEKAIVDYMTGLDMSLFVCDYDHNAPNWEHLEKTHEPLYRAMREKHPCLPIIFISMPNYDTGFDAGIRRLDLGNGTAKRRRIIFETYTRALEEGDRNVYYLDGESLFGGADRGDCTVDGAHPNDLGFSRMADRIGSMIERILF